jgi:S-adenosylmethionine:tRNA ribosyltransferase-isomerase
MPELDQYDYDLPKDLIAQSPSVCRTDARLLLVDRERKSLKHRHIRDLPEILGPHDCLVINDTRVVPARLVGRRVDTGGHWEGLFLDAGSDGLWRLLCKTRGKLRPGETIILVSPEGREDVRLQLGLKQDDGVWIARPLASDDAMTLLDRVGHVPLPPYIRHGKMVADDRENYQTVFAQVPGAVAAPTAGLHFTAALLDRLRECGVQICSLTLHVGHGTFRPIVAEKLAEHRMHSEWGQVTQEAIGQIESCRRQGGRIVAVGTTSVRLLETAASQEISESALPLARDVSPPDGSASKATPQRPTLKPFVGYTNLFIRPPYTFRAVDILLTNFHLPRTTLLVLVRAFGGDELMRQAYDEAIREKYRFYSYGDAMLIL